MADVSEAAWREILWRRKEVRRLELRFEDLTAKRKLVKEQLDDANRTETGGAAAADGDGRGPDGPSSPPAPAPNGDALPPLAEAPPPFLCQVSEAAGSWAVRFGRGDEGFSVWHPMAADSEKEAIAAAAKMFSLDPAEIAVVAYATPAKDEAQPEPPLPLLDAQPEPPAGKGKGKKKTKGAGKRKTNADPEPEETPEQRQAKRDSYAADVLGLLPAWARNPAKLADMELQDAAGDSPLADWTEAAELALAIHARDRSSWSGDVQRAEAIHEWRRRQRVALEKLLDDPEPTWDGWAEFDIRLKDGQVVTVIYHGPMGYQTDFRGPVSSTGFWSDSDHGDPKAGTIYDWAKAKAQALADTYAIEQTKAAEKDAKGRKRAAGGKGKGKGGAAAGVGGTV